MRQVPDSAPSRAGISYVFLGNGRLSRHLQFYFNSLNISYEVWTRQSSRDLASFSDADVFLLAVNDSAIESLAEQLKGLYPQKTIIHFAGALTTPLAEAWHPLMTFSEKLFAADFYPQIAFVGEKGRRDFAEIFPQLSNPRFTIASEMRPLYHAFCVISGNLSQFLWAQSAQAFEEKLGLPANILRPYLEVCLDSFFSANSGLKSDLSSGLNPRKGPLTGPLVRRDYKTLQAHIKALQKNSFLPAYLALVKAYGETHEDFRFSEIQS